MPILKRSSYYENDYRQSPALIRARRPYIFKNAITGVAIMSFALGVFAFTLKAVGQDTFEDVVVPDATSQPPKTPNVQAGGR
ncbi:uncharacterized protein HMPREF1541_08271 [Cyphellophora europaea CBS 101466]|uniref:Cytochrome c oxidase assembly factor 3 n=1 Tax=Cyphellophora europaea (strain CBS 101466) TaxID=1220924 RepID=W2RLT9_CYPE1|nr:uncharacterized protein HMPREF1541_08271 [Cyphellophora europaea CBS 101466]ETN37280.1 hypothetical protein HMPREF1541_08271 [Cyphellophora europaea CBS 101466]